MFHTCTAFLEYIPFDAPDIDDDWQEAEVELEWRISPGTHDTWDHPGDPAEAELVSATAELADGSTVDLMDDDAAGIRAERLIIPYFRLAETPIFMMRLPPLEKQVCICGLFLYRGPV